MKIVTSAEMRAIDRRTSEQFGVPSLMLMENAGSALAHFVFGNYPHAEHIGIVCGKGNNGGDGFVAARKLMKAGRGVRVLLLCNPSDLRGDAAEMFEQLRLECMRSDRGNAGRTPVAPSIVPDIAGLASPEAAEVFTSDLLIDAILGTGFRPPVSDLYAAAIAKMNTSPAPTISVDIPSGADADAMGPGRRTESGIVARSSAVVTFTSPRPAHVFANLTSGQTVIAAIGSPPDAVVSDLALNLSTPADFAGLLAPRQLEANKGSYGHVLVIGGSLGKAGAAAMAGFAALRSGAGLSTIATPKSVMATVASFHPEIMTEGFAETDRGTIAACSTDALAEIAKGKTVIAIGPGISRHPETSEFVRRAARRDSLPQNAAIVLDADALNAFEGAADQLNGTGRTLVITPHPGEMSRLTGLSIAQIQADRIAVARKFAREHDLHVVLKGHRTLVASPDGMIWVNPTGNPGMATGGTGDILTGMVSGLIAQHPQAPLDATALAVYLHGLAGDLAAAALGESSLVATDLLRFLPDAFAKARSQPTGEFFMHG